MASISTLKTLSPVAQKYSCHSQTNSRSRVNFTSEIYRKSKFLGESISCNKQTKDLKVKSTLIVLSSSTKEKTAIESGNIFDSFGDFFQNMLRGLKGETLESSSMKENSEESQISKSVFVAGATGKLGKVIVKKLLEKNARVTVLVGSEEKAKKTFVEELGLSFGKTSLGGELVTAVGDLQDDKVIRDAIKGCDSIICAVGTRYSGSGVSGFLPNGSPEEVYGNGIPSLIRAAQDEFESQGNARQERQELTLFDFTQKIPPKEEQTKEPKEEAEDGTVKKPANRSGVPTGVADWFVLDDVIMGGISDGRLVQEEGKAVFEGTLRSEGGGFSSIRSQVRDAPVDLSKFDGIHLRVKGDGQRYKLGVRTQADFKGTPYVAMFDTIRNKWTDVFVPFERLQAVERSTLVESADPIPSHTIYSVQILASLFQFNKEANRLATPGPFRLEVASIGAYASPRPSFVLVSSAAVERSARAVSREQREASIPIVKLNPGGVLNWKLLAEDALRSSGLLYSVVRPCGLTEKDSEASFILEVAQGDVITGLLSREEAASVVVAAVDSPSVVNATFEVRRDDLTKGLEPLTFSELFRGLRPDARTGDVRLLPPIAPIPLAPPAPAKEEEEEK